LKARKRKMAGFHAGDLVLTRTEYKYLKDHPEDALSVIGVPGIIMETFRDNFEVLIDWSLLSDNHDHRGRDRWSIDDIVKVGSLGKEVLYPDGEMLHEELFEELTAFLASQVDFSAYPYPGGEGALEARTEVLTWEWLTEVKGFSTEKAKEVIEGWEPSRRSQYHERKIPAGQLQIGDLFIHEGKDYVVTGIQQNGYIRSKPIPSGTVRWFAPHYKVRLIKTAEEGASDAAVLKEKGIKVTRTRHQTLDGKPLPFDQVILEMSDGSVRGPMPLDEAHLLMWEIGQWGPFEKGGIAQRVAVNIRNETRGTHHGQYDGVLIAADPATGEYRGHLDYAYLEEPGEEILIQWVEVPEEYRRQGIASQLVEKLKAENPGREVNWGYTSEEGTALREVSGVEIKVGDKLLDNKTDLVLTVVRIEKHKDWFQSMVVLQWPIESVYPLSTVFTPGSELLVPLPEVERALETGLLIRLGQQVPVVKSKNWLYQLAKRIEKRNLEETGESLTAGSIMGHLSKAVVEVREDVSFIDMGKLDSLMAERGWKVVGRLIRIAPAWVEDESIWEKAKKEVDRSKYDSEESYYAVVTTVYKNMGGKVKKKEAQSGMCYPDAFRFVLGTEEGELVHGTITNPDGAVMDHAWVEFPTGFVWEPESKNFFKKDAFYSGKTPAVHHRYTGTEASIMAVKTGHFGPWAGRGAQTERVRCPRCGEEVAREDLAPHEDKRVRDFYDVPWNETSDVCPRCRLTPWEWFLGEGKTLLLEKRSSIEEIKESLEGNEIWTDQLPHGRDVVGVMDGRVWAQLPDTGLTDVTDQIDWNKLMNEMMIQEFGPGWEERLREEFRVEGQLERKSGKPTWGDNTIRNTGGGRFELVSPEGQTLDTVYISDHIDESRVEGIHIDDLAGRFEKWVQGIKDTVPREQFTLGDLVHLWSYEKGLESRVERQAGDTLFRQTVSKGGKKHIRTVRNIEFVERGEKLKLRGLVTIGGTEYVAYHVSGDRWYTMGPSWMYGLSPLPPLSSKGQNVRGSLGPGDWDPRDLKEATTVISEEFVSPICHECTYYDPAKSVDNPLIFPDKGIYCTYLIDYVIARSECPYFSPRVKSIRQQA